MKLLRLAFGSKLRLLLATVPPVVLLGGIALAYFTTSGSGKATASIGALSAPTAPGATAGAGTVAVSWSTVSPPAGNDTVTYYVTRSGGAPGGDCPTAASPSTVTSCTDSGLAAGTYSYTVTAVWRSWSMTSSSTGVTLASGALDHYALAAATGTPAAGVADNLTITAKDSAGNTVTTYGGDRTLTFTGAGTIGSYQPTVTSKTGSAVAFGTAETITFTSGVAAVSGTSNGGMTLYKAESATVTVSDGTYTGTVSVTTGPAAAASFAVSAPSSATAGSSFGATVTAKDTYGNTATGYAGSHAIDFSGPHAAPSGTSPSYPANVSFTSGAGTASVTLYDSETTAITAADHASPGITGTSGSVAVAAGTPASLSLSMASTTPTAGVADNLTVTALDTWLNTATGYSGDKSVTFSGPGIAPDGSTHPTVTSKTGTAVAFGTAETITFTNGVASVSGSSNGVMKLYKAETTSVVVSDGTISNGGGVSVTVSPASAAGLSLSAASTTPTAGVADNLTITARDTWLNTATGYTGDKSLTFSGANVAPDGSTHPTVTSKIGVAVAFGTAETITFTSGVASVSGSSNGVMKLYKAETASVVVSDGTLSNGSGLSVTVAPASAATLTLSAASTTPTAGVADNLTITALDTWLNTATSYTGDKSVTFSGASLAPDGSTHPTVTSKTGTAVAFGTAETITFTNGVASVSGSSNGVMKLYKAETASVVVSDGSISNGTGLSVTVGPGTAASLSLSAASTTPTAGVADNLTITAQDTWLNTATAYTGSKALTFGGASSIGINSPTVANSLALATAFGLPTTVTFTSGVASVSGSSNGVMTLYKAEAASVTVSDGSISNGSGLSVTVSGAAVANIAATSGSGQSAIVTFAFTNPLAATVTDTYGNPKSGVTVTFGAPSSGTSATFASGGNCTSNPQTYQCVASTDASGVATSSAFTANATTGAYNIAATASGGSNPSVNFSETNSPKTWPVYSAIGTVATRTSSGSATVNYPAGTAANDLLFLVEMNGANSNPTLPSGWTQLADQGSGSNPQYRFTVWWKLAGAETSVSLTMSTNASGASAWVIRYVRPSGYPPNPATATAAVAQGNSAASATFTPTSVTTNAANATVVSIAAIRAQNTLSLSTPQSFALETTATAKPGSVGVTLGFADAFVPTSGTSPTAPTWSQSGTAALWAWATVAFH